jgi:hypothetical protein
MADMFAAGLRDIIAGGDGVAATEHGALFAAEGPTSGKLREKLDGFRARVAAVDVYEMRSNSKWG